MLQLSFFSESIEVPAAAEAVWATIGKFEALGSWYPGVTSFRIIKNGDATIREIGSSDGTTYTERLLWCRPEQMSLCYELDAGDLDVTVYLSVISVRHHAAKPGSALATWDVFYYPTEGEAVTADKDIEEIVSAGLNNLRAHFEPARPLRGDSD